MDEAEDVGVDDPPLLDGADDGGEVVVGDDHVGRLLGDLGPLDAHGDADVGLLQGRGVVHPVAGHGHHLAPRPAGPRRSAACARARRGRTRPPRRRSVCQPAASRPASSRPWTVRSGRPWGSRSRPSWRPISAAVACWSPVIITVRMPASRQVAMAAFASSRSGSIMPTSPTKTSPAARSSSL